MWGPSFLGSSVTIGVPADHLEPTVRTASHSQGFHPFISYSFILFFIPQIFTKPALCPSTYRNELSVRGPTALCGSEREIRKSRFPVFGACPSFCLPTIDFPFFW